MTTHFHWFPLTDKDFTTILLMAYPSFSTLLTLDP